MTIKLALCGRMRSGKDAIAEYLAANYEFKRFAFGDGIREICRQLYPDQFEGGAKPRALLQGFGQMARQFDDFVWINRTLNVIDMYNAQIRKPHVVISDLRQPNEYAALQKEGFVIIRVTAPEDTRIQRMLAAGDAFNPTDLVHETESHVDSFAVDYEITNGGTLEELFMQVDRLMSELLADRQR
jgi:dephospho-CoA kinase